MDKLLYDDRYYAMRKERATVPPRQAPLSGAELRKRALARQLEREPYSIGSADPHARTEFGTVETSLGTVIVAHDRQAGELIVHGVHVALGEMDGDLRRALTAASSGFDAAQSAEDQVGAKVAVGLITSELLRRNGWLQTEVGRRVAAQRFG